MSPLPRQFVASLPALQLPILPALLLSAVVCTAARADERQDLEHRFEQVVRPFLEQHCLDCHGPDVQEARLDLSGYRSLKSVVSGHRTWEIVRKRLASAEMPPSDADPQPSAARRQQVVEWIETAERFEARRNEGDPGPVLARRLSNAEYDYSIRDLTGVDIRPARQFPVDPANEAGFDNTGESLTMSPALLRKYLAAAREVSEHMVLTPEGISFADHPVMTDTDRDKYCVRRIVAFYRRQPVDLADYFYAAWLLRGELPPTRDVIARVAAQRGVSPRYLQLVQQVLTRPEQWGPLAHLQRLWTELPTASDRTAARAACRRMRDAVNLMRTRLKPRFENLTLEGSHKGSQPFVLWKNKQYAAHRRRWDRSAIDEVDDRQEGADDPLIAPPDPSDRAAFEEAVTRFCDTFPDAFFVSERGRDYLDSPRTEQEKGRYLSAGFHSMMGYFRDDGPLYDMVLSEAEQRELDQLWRELNFVTAAPLRQFSGFVWFERTDSRYMRDPEFDFARAEDKDVTSAAKLLKLADVYLAKAKRSGADEVDLQAIDEYFREINLQIRGVEADRLAAQPNHFASLLSLAARAWRRGITLAEQSDLRDFYDRLRRDDGLTHEEAVQDTFVAILMSPHFCYRMDLAGQGGGVRHLSETELASRLSYFLWSSLPDVELLNLARQGRLAERDVLTGQIKRMLGDPRVSAMAREFAGHWLDFRRFQEHNSVDRERFPAFTDELRQAMFEEPVRFFVDLVQRDASVLGFLDADHTFANRVLRRHYGIPELSVDRPPGDVAQRNESGDDDWQRIEGASRFGRGGILPMSVFLTMNAPGLRTSPVKRGYWVVRRVLGEEIPAPPPNVPELPADESALGDRTLRETLARHREHESCAACHDRFDAIGLAFEGYGPVGESRTHDLGGRPIETSATFPGGQRGAGVSGLREYIRDQRQEEYLDNLCRKLLSYGLGRSLLLSDSALLARMRANLEADDYRFGSLVETIVTSPQFLRKRGEGHVVQGVIE